MKAYKDIDDCIKNQPLEFQKPLEDLRVFIHKLIPDCTECICYGMPTFKLWGKAFAGFNGYKNFMSFYPFSGTILKEFSKELTDFECEKSAIHFTPEKPIPEDLLKKIILKRLEVFTRN
jgi:uncharacterized protein YdhG (YjbR/CyaY superfamily)